MNTIFVTFKVEDSQTAAVVCQGQSKIALVNENESAKDVVRAWTHFLEVRFDPEKFNSHVWWKPGL